MHFLSRKAQGLPWKLILTLIVGVVSLFILLGIVGIAKAATTDGLLENGPCWASNTLACGGGAIAGAIPNFCNLEVVDEAVSKEQLAILLRDTWWQYKQGECDMGSAGAEIYPVYAFVPEEEGINLGEFFAYIMQYNRGIKVDEIEYSDYSYLESGTSGLTLCFDSRDDKLAEFTLTPEGGPYYIMFYDNRQNLGTEVVNDMVLISNDPSFDADFWGRNIDAVLFTISGALVSSVTGGLPVLYLFATEGTIIPLKAKELAADPAITLVADSDRGCVVYGPENPADWHNTDVEVDTEALVS
jgi:hypothetical protein